MRDPVYYTMCYTEAESKSFYPVRYVFIKDGGGCAGVRIDVHLFPYLGVCIPDRHRHIATPIYQTPCVFKQHTPHPPVA